MTYKTFGTCSRAIHFEINDGIIQSVEFVGGCDGNTTGLSRLLAGMSIDTAIERLAGIDCNGKGTSCPDQLARALKLYKEQTV